MVSEWRLRDRRRGLVRGGTALTPATSRFGHFCPSHEEVCPAGATVIASS